VQTARIEGGGGRLRGGKGVVAQKVLTKKTPKATERQRNMKAYLDDNRGRNKSDIRYAANVLRTRLSKKEREALGVNTLGGYIDKMAKVGHQRSKYGLSKNQADGIIGKVQRASLGNIRGIRVRQDSAGRWQLDVDSLTRKQSVIAEKAGSRKPRRRR
jgi:hypothetical protein